ncbi:MAG: hypothetical protein KF817_15180 [Phycisphaeraceae bacterium]|nr:hypothetical protein [Phycisphaeraceae bacterium]
MNDLARGLIDLGAAGVELARAGDRIRFRPALPPDALEWLTRYRAAVLALLESGYDPEDAEARYVLLERLGIADDLDMPTDPGAPAWLVAVGESMLLAQCEASGVYSPHDTDGGPAGGARAMR